MPRIARRDAIQGKIYRCIRQAREEQQRSAKRFRRDSVPKFPKREFSRDHAPMSSKGCSASQYGWQQGFDQAGVLVGFPGSNTATLRLYINRVVDRNR